MSIVRRPTICNFHYALHNWEHYECGIKYTIFKHNSVFFLVSQHCTFDPKWKLNIQLTKSSTTQTLMNGVEIALRRTPTYILPLPVFVCAVTADTMDVKPPPCQIIKIDSTSILIKFSKAGRNLSKSCRPCSVRRSKFRHSRPTLLISPGNQLCDSNAQSKVFCRHTAAWDPFTWFTSWQLVSLANEPFRSYSNWKYTSAWAATNCNENIPIDAVLAVIFRGRYVCVFM